MTGRNVVLLTDNFSAHQAGVTEIISSGIPLENTLIIWLPANSTSRFQPLDQGVINCWKTHWKRHWIKYILQEFESNRNPIHTANVLKAIRWGIQSWEFNVSGNLLRTALERLLIPKIFIKNLLILL